MERLHLIVSASAADGPEGPRDPPALSALRVRGRGRAAAAHLTDAVCRAFGLNHGWPLAPYTLALDGVEPGGWVWMRADPVSLQLFRDHLVLADAPVLGVTAEEAGALVEALNRHFAADGLRFLAPVPQRWYLALDVLPRLAAQPPEAAAGRDVRSFLPRGADAAVWLARLNEAQMLLHDHPVNEAREASGALPVNSLWTWGAGRHGSFPAPPYDGLCATHPTALALAGAGGMPVWEAAGWSDLAGRAGRSLVVLDAAQDAERIEADWLRPALRALRTGRLRGLRLDWLGPSAFSSDLTPGDAWKFWRG